MWMIHSVPSNSTLPMKDKCEWYTVYHQTAPYLWKVSVNNDTQSTIKQHPTYERCGRSGEELVGQRRCGRHDVEDLVQASEDILVISKQSLWDGKHIYMHVSCWTDQLCVTSCGKHSSTLQCLCSRSSRIFCTTMLSFLSVCLYLMLCFSLP